MRDASREGVRCRLCHRGPTAEASLFEHHGYGVPLKHLVLRGPLCRQCGLVAWRRMTLQTLLLGWWGLASIVLTPVTLVLNAIALARLLRTPEAPAIAVHPLRAAEPLTRTA
ncbi:MAG: hypothetical protein WCB85_06905 [Candidatus Dormiibacterota bacterium]